MQQKRKLVVFIAASLDGYIATEDENLDWLFETEGEGDNGYTEFYDTVDTILIGKRTYDWVMEHENGSFPYKGKECYVFTRTPQPDTEFVRFVTGDDLSALTGRLQSEKGNNIWIVGGGELLHAFLEQGLVDELIVTVAPVLIGRGIPLFRPGDYRLKLRLTEMRRFNQFAELRYEVLHGLQS